MADTGLLGVKQLNPDGKEKSLGSLFPQNNARWCHLCGTAGPHVWAQIVTGHNGTELHCELERGLPTNVYTKYLVMKKFPPISHEHAPSQAQKGHDFHCSRGFDHLHTK